MAQKEYNPKIEYIKTNRNHEAILIDNKYIFNFNRIQEYYIGAHIIKKIAKYSALIKIKLEIEKYQSNHYHNIKETAGANARAKSEIKDKIANLKNPFNIKTNNLYKESIKDKGFLVPDYNSISSSVNRIINKIIPNEITNFDEIPDEHDYFKTLTGDKFLLGKGSTYVIFQSEYQDSLH